MSKKGLRRNKKTAKDARENRKKLDRRGMMIPGQKFPDRHARTHANNASLSLWREREREREREKEREKRERERGRERDPPTSDSFALSLFLFSPSCSGAKEHRFNKSR